ncbi:MAG TPA: transcription-repair coupling factor, partial [Anaerolineae bacterium]|nr:transcription-repair coupling factor [Anaerolineae bacterium]HUM36562.1 transcription-repair coupling factor [Anaerolineae bacterium]
IAMSLNGLLSWIRERPAYQTLREQLASGTHVPAQVAPAPAIPAVLAALVEDLPGPHILLTPTAAESRQLLQALRTTWLRAPERLLSFPEPQVMPYERAAWAPETITDRLTTLSTLFLQRADTAGDVPPPIIVTSARAVMQRLLPYRQFRRAARRIATGSRDSLTALARHCRGIGYESVSVVEAPGQISQRGGLLDIFPPHAAQPYRLDFFGDEIEAIRTFEPATQRSTGRVEGFWLTPVREALPQDGARAAAALRASLEEDLLPEVRTPLEADLQALEAGVPFPTLEYYLPYMYQETSTLLSYLPPEGRLILYNAEALPGRWAELYAEAEALRQRARAEHLPGSDAPLPYSSWENWEGALADRVVLPLNPGEEGPLAELFAPAPHFAGKLGEALGRLRQWTKLGDQIVVVSRQGARLAELWQEFTPPPVLETLDAPPETLITFVQGVVAGGWQMPAAAAAVQGLPHITRHLITDEELFGWRPPEPRRRPRRRVAAPEFAFADLQPGTAVVHEDYGIGIFQGLVTRSVDDIEREYLLLEYEGRDRLYVPIHQADRLSRYIGAEGQKPLLTHLGGTSWAEVKARVRLAATELAGELLDLYAKRKVVEGHAFAPDSPWQAELEAAFPYLETEDQVEAIQAVKQDMEAPQPMDRLICGDAGYGKTEVALRAAFKAVMDGKQVAMLVPTTVLAQQHFQTFSERLKPFPVNVELLSRFRTDAEQRLVLQRLAEGKVDIVIGTHRLLQRDVRFKDLGLIIIDEEQRFGVSHKEKLKQMRTEVDVLTLTATPIPRTLYMALMGVRDVSIIETPPQERLPTFTYIGPYSGEIARRVILRELERGGQVFYVHNRVESIATIESRLRELVPEASIGVGHGQMHERELAQVMEKFAAGEINVLLATTIIESGLDFPNANTIIVERADRFGLAQLYQLRGRVGRGARRGYAYLFHGRRMNEEARQRLQALQETTSRGGGFAIALHDLEIRGAGEMLGARQHGHIAAVGFTLYTQILTNAIDTLKAQREGKPAPPPPIGGITLELPLAVGIPADFIPDEALRLQLYRRMAELTDETQIGAFEEELRDRFGPLPETTGNLIYQLRLKVLARDAHLPAIAIESGQIVLRPSWLKELPNESWHELHKRLQPYGRVGRREIWLPLTLDQSQWQVNLQNALEQLADWQRSR